MDLAGALAFLNEHTNLESLLGGPKRLPSLDRITELARILGDPQHTYPVLHVTGTNGKTSTARLMSRLLEVANLNVGLFTSPHLERVNERMSVNLEPISDEELAREVSEIAGVVPLMSEPPTYFDLLTAVALSWFADIPVHVAVIEVGLLGRFDTTNIVDGAIAVVTNVGADHLDYAGTIERVAWEKAGIVKPGSTLVLGERDPELCRPFLEEGAAVVWRRDADFACTASRIALGGRVVDLRTPGAAYDEVFLSLHGDFQGDNAAAALTAVEAFHERPLPRELVEEAFASATSPGRMEVLGHKPLVVIDGAHNADGLAALAASVAESFRITGRWIVVHGLLSPHDPVASLAALDLFPGTTVIACAPDWPRAVPSGAVAEAARETGLDVIDAGDVPRALATALELASEDDLVLVCGSLYVAGEARTLLRHRLL